MNLPEMKTAYSTLVTEAGALAAEMQSDETKNTEDNLALLQTKTKEAEALAQKIAVFENVAGLRVTVTEGEGRKTQENPQLAVVNDIRQKSIGELFTESEAYKNAIKDGKINPNTRAIIEAKGFLFPGSQKATFTTTSTGLDSTVNYVTPPGGMVMVEQQRLTVRDLLSVGETTMNSIPYIKETSFTNYADMVAEEGEKPEATLLTEDATAPVKKIAVVLKVTDEMYADFPMLRDYINTRLRFMVLAKEEQQLLNGTGAGNQITGILQTSGIQTQAKGGDSNFIAIHKAITKIRSVGFYEPDGIVIHPTDWQLLRIAVDGNTQFYGGGPFSDQYGSGPYPQNPMLWGLRPAITTAITAGTALVGAFKLGAQIWQRQGVTVDSTNSNEDDFNFNRITLRVEERLALAVYRPLAFCTVTSIA
jgi:HK97 family phage major capsid protein